MAESENSFDVVSSVIKNAVAALRDLAVFVLFVLMWFWPTAIRERIESAGISKIGPGGIEWEAQAKRNVEQTKTAGEKVDLSLKSNEAVAATIKELESKSVSPETKEALRKVGEIVAGSKEQLESADKALKRSLATQQDIVAQVSPGSVAEAGWIYLGKVSEDKGQWAEGSPKTVQAVPPQNLRGAKLAIRDDVYIRADSGQSSRSSAAIVGVAKVGEALKVTDIEHSHARGGGWFVWAKVQRT